MFRIGIIVSDTQLFTNKLLEVCSQSISVTSNRGNLRGVISVFVERKEFGNRKRVPCAQNLTYFFFKVKISAHSHWLPRPVSFCAMKGGPITKRINDFPSISASGVNNYLVAAQIKI